MNGPPKPPKRLDCYEVLGVNKNAHSSTIEKAYRRLQLTHHPDSRRAGAKPSTELFQNVGIAWETLSDEKRPEYDKNHPEIREEWSVYRENLGIWKAKQWEKAQRQERLQERQRKTAEKEAKLEKERAVEVERKQAESIKVEKARRAEQTAREEIKQREEEVSRLQERLQEEPRQQELARVKEEQARIRADWERAQKRSQEEERIARKQREADERQTNVFAIAQERQREAAEERLRRQRLDFESSKRAAPDDIEEAQDLTNAKKAKFDRTLTPSLRLRKAMALEQARRKHSERLREVGGPGNEYRLRDESIDLGWKHVHYQHKPCPQCYTKKSAAQFGLWECPEEGALRCRPCLAALSTFGA